MIHIPLGAEATITVDDSGYRATYVGVYTRWQMNDDATTLTVYHAPTGYEFDLVVLHSQARTPIAWRIGLDTGYAAKFVARRVTTPEDVAMDALARAGIFGLRAADASYFNPALYDAILDRVEQGIVGGSLTTPSQHASPRHHQTDDDFLRSLGIAPSGEGGKT